MTSVVKPGDTLSKLLGDHLTPQQIHDLARQCKPVFPPNRIAAGQSYSVCSLDGAFTRFVYEIDAEEQLLVSPGEEGFDILRVPIEYDTETHVVHGTIQSSLFEAVAEIGEQPELALALADIYAWDIDFILDIRKGDSFQALVEKRYRDGRPAGYGRVLAAEFVNQGEVYRAVQFAPGGGPGGYFDAEGRSLRKAFLKAPLSFSRISSGYSKRRYHPITKTWKAHPAIDYAAPTGTPIKTVGDGVVLEKGYTSGNGNYVKIRHNSTYETLYLHMSRFAKNVQKGKKVAQGQVIGYVGSTGLATGPHLCFRMYKNGTPVNPLGVKSVAAEPVAAKHLAEFKARAGDLLAELRSAELKHASLSSTPPTNRSAEEGDPASH